MRKEHPILFSTPMVQAINEGKKSMTRRAIVPTIPEMFVLMVNMNVGIRVKESIEELIRCSCPYGSIGDLLWVREKFKPKHVKGGLEGFKMQYPHVHPWFYAADGESEPGYRSWKPSIHMPKEAARIWLEITNIRAERLLDISEEDAVKEGVELLDFGDSSIKIYDDYLYNSSSCRTAKQSFASLWQSINGAESWNENPWVWVIEFKKVNHKPIPA